MTDGNAHESPARVYWTALIGLLFDYYDYYLFIYLGAVLAATFKLSAAASDTLQFVGMAGVGLGALGFGFLADRRGRGPVMLAVFGVYVAGVAGLSLAQSFTSLLIFRLLASLALGAEWGISHTYLAERVSGERRYRFSALLQFAILGGLIAALAAKYVMPAVGWRWLFAFSIVPVAALSAVRWRSLARAKKEAPRVLVPGVAAPPVSAFLRCFAIASLTIASGTVNLFFAKELPQSPWYTVMFWVNVAPGMLIGAWVVRRWGVKRALLLYSVLLVALSGFAWGSSWSGRKLAFAIVLSLLNGIPFGLMGAYFNEVFSNYRTTLSGAAYNLGRILAGFSPFFITALGLNQGGNYFLFTAALGVGVFAVGLGMMERRTAI